MHLSHNESQVSVLCRNKRRTANTGAENAWHMMALVLLKHVLSVEI